VQHVPLGGRRRQDDHRDATEFRIRLELDEDLPPVLLGQVEVEEHEVGNGRIRVRVTPMKEVHCFLPVHARTERHQRAWSWQAEISMCGGLPFANFSALG
jgi:hypothetical protein